MSTKSICAGRKPKDTCEDIKTCKWVNGTSRAYCRSIPTTKKVKEITQTVKPAVKGAREQKQKQPIVLKKKTVKPKSQTPVKPKIQSPISTLTKSSQEISPEPSSVQGSPKVIGVGTYGCVYSPPLQCKNRDPVESTKISKYMTKESAKIQLAEAMSMKNVDPNSIVTVNDAYMCEPKTHPTDCRGPKDTLLIYPNGGHDLYKILGNIQYYGGFGLMFKNFGKLIEGVAMLNANRTFHIDIKEQNIVTGKDGRGPYRLIDFGLSISTEPRSSPDLLFTSFYPYWPIDAIVLGYKSLPEITLKAHVNKLYAHGSLSRFYKQAYSKPDIFNTIKDRIKNRIADIKIIEKIDVYSLAVILLGIVNYDKSKLDKKTYAAINELLIKSNVLHYDSLVRCDTATFSKMYNALVLPTL